MTNKDTYINVSDGLLYCNHCKKALQLPHTYMGVKRIIKIMCDCEAQEFQDDRDDLERRERIDEIKRREHSGVQDNCLYEYRFENDNGSNPKMEIAHKYVENWDKEKAKAQGLLLYGDVGTGKSFMAGCIANALIEQGISVLMTSMQTIIKEMSPSSALSRDLNEYIRSINRNSLLILDDLGVERKTDYVKEQLFCIINSRYNERKPMIITTNMTPDMMKKTDDTDLRRIYDRILERCVPVVINSNQYRSQNAEKNILQFKDMLNGTKR